MSWRLRFLPGGYPVDHSVEIGDCWYFPNWDDPQHRQFYLDRQLSRQYREQWLDKRPPIIVKIPSRHGGGFPLCIDDAYRGGSWGDNPQQEGWTVTGSPEDGTLTVSPSINCIGAYHGWLQNGVLSDDLEAGR